MNKKQFEEIKEKYERERKRLEQISKGDFVWERVPRETMFDYHPAIVIKVNVDEDYIEVIDVSDRNERKRYYHFLTEDEMLNEGFTKSGLEEEHQKYSKIRDKITRRKLKKKK